MTASELKRQIRQASKVYGWIKITADDGAYIQLVKQNLLFHIVPGVEYNAEMRDGGEDLYIN